MSHEPTLVEIFLAPSLWLLLGFVLLWFWVPVLIGWFFGEQIRAWWHRHRLFALPPWRRRGRERINRLAARVESRQRGTNHSKEKL